MIAVLSPAKKLDFSSPDGALQRTQPLLSRDTRELLTTAKQASVSELQTLMKLSQALAELNHQRFQDFATRPKPESTKQAALAFNGDTYAGLQAWDFDAEDFEFAQNHLFILSGLYGLLRPLDAIQPYRLEMGTKLRTPRGKNLYAFWGARIAKELNRSAQRQAAEVIVNLASTEYFSAVDLKTLRPRVVTAVFKEGKGSDAKVIGFCAKRARGMMARYVIKNRLDTPDGLKDFTDAGYRFLKRASTADSLVFIRPRG